MLETNPSPTPPSDDDVRWLLVRTAASFSRLWARLDSIRLPPSRPASAAVSQDINLREEWLDVLPYNVALSGVIRAVILPQALLLDEAVANRSPDRRRICLIVQHIQCNATEWSAGKRRLAKVLGVPLADTVIAETGGSSLHNAIHQLDGTHARYRAVKLSMPAVPIPRGCA